MSIRTAEQLSDCLSEELRWRRKELVILRSLIESTKPFTDKQETLIRSGITLLYAHWEGFVKAAASAYLELVARQGLPYQELTTNFIALAIKRKLEEAPNTNKAYFLTNEIVEFLRKRLSEKSYIPYKNIIKSSNLSSENFKEIIYTLNFDYSLYQTKEKIIDEKCLHSRNDIAHGKNLLIDLEEYLEVHQEIVELMNTFKTQIENAAYTQAYRLTLN